MTVFFGRSEEEREELKKREAQKQLRLQEERQKQEQLRLQQEEQFRQERQRQEQFRQELEEETYRENFGPRESMLDQYARQLVKEKG
jgi:transposase